MSDLTYNIREIIKNNIHIAKCNADLPKETWQKIDIDKIAKSCVEEIKSILESYLYLPCCHTTGMHDPCHFKERKYICTNQKARAFERFCKELGVNPITRSELGCCWCSNPVERNGEGLSLFTEKKGEAES